MIINVKNFGVYGNETQDDTEALQAILKGFPTSTIFFPDGTYKISGELVLNEGQKLLGSGMNQTILKYVKDEGNLINTNETAHIDIENLSLIHDFEIEVIGVKNTAKAISANKTPYLRLKNVTIKGFDYGVHYGELCYCSSMDNVIIQSCNFGFNANGEFNGVTINKLIATYCDIGAYVGGGRTVTLNDCLFELNNLGVRKVNMGDLNIKACYFERNSQDIASNFGANAPYKITISDSSFFKNENNSIENKASIYLHGDNKTLVIIRNCEFTKYNLASYAILEGYSGTPVRVILEDNYIDDGVEKIKSGHSFKYLADKDSFTLNKASSSYKHSHSPNFVAVDSNNKVFLDGDYDSYRIHIANNTEIFLPEKNLNGNSYEIFLTIDAGKSVQIKVNPNSTGDSIGNSPLYTNNTGAKQYLVGKVYMLVSRATGVEYGLVWFNI